MKRFTLGLALGTTAGIILSLVSIKDKRLGSIFKKNLEETHTDLTNLQEGIQKAQSASNSLSENLPAASRAMSDIQDDFSKFQNHTKYRRQEIKYQAEKVKNNPLSRKFISAVENYLEDEYEAGKKLKDKKD